MISTGVLRQKAELLDWPRVRQDRKSERMLREAWWRGWGCCRILGKQLCLAKSRSRGRNVRGETENYRRCILCLIMWLDLAFWFTGAARLRVIWLWAVKALLLTCKILWLWGSCNKRWMVEITSLIVSLGTMIILHPEMILSLLSTLWCIPAI